MFQNYILQCFIFTTIIFLKNLVSSSNHDFSNTNLNIINDGPSNLCQQSQLQPESYLSLFGFFVAGVCGFILLYIFIRLAYFGSKSQLGFKKKRADDDELSQSISDSFLNVLMGELALLCTCKQLKSSIKHFRDQQLDQ
jgi:hypothetical protein